MKTETAEAKPKTKPEFRKEAKKAISETDLQSKLAALKNKFN